MELYVVEVNQDEDKIKLYDKKTGIFRVRPKEEVIAAYKNGSLDAKGITIDASGTAQFKCYTKEEIFPIRSEFSVLREQLLEAIGDRTDYEGFNQEMHVDYLCNFVLDMCKCPYTRRLSQVEAHSDLGGYCGLSYQFGLHNDRRATAFVGIFMPKVPRELLKGSIVTSIILQIYRGNDLFMYEALYAPGTNHEAVSVSSLEAELKKCRYYTPEDLPDDFDIKDSLANYYGRATMPFTVDNCDFSYALDSIVDKTGNTPQTTLAYPFSLNTGPSLAIGYVSCLRYSGLTIEPVAATRNPFYIQYKFRIPHKKASTNKYLDCTVKYLESPYLDFHFDAPESIYDWRALIITYTDGINTETVTIRVAKRKECVKDVTDAHNYLIKKLGYEKLDANYNGEVVLNRNAERIASQLQYTPEALQTQYSALCLVNIYMELNGRSIRSSKCSRVSNYALTWVQGDVSFLVEKVNPNKPRIVDRYKVSVRRLSNDHLLESCTFSYPKYEMPFSTCGKLQSQFVNKLKHKLFKAAGLPIE